MKPHALMILTLGFVAVGCNASTRSDGPEIVAEVARQNVDLVREKPSPENRRPCADPVALPKRDLTEGETERFWHEDRIRLVVCGRRHAAVLSFYEDRDKRIAGEK